MDAPVDLLIIGQGLAGSVLACEARDRGMSIHVIDQGHAHAASMVAAGMWNPVSFRKIIEVWKAKEVMHFLQNRYPKWEKDLGAFFFHPKPVARVFPNEEYADLWKKRISEGMSWITLGTKDLPGANHPHGYGLVPDAGFVHLPHFLAAVRDRLKEENALSEEVFEEDRLVFKDDCWNYGEIRVKHVVLSVGTSGMQLKNMEGLPLRTNKGEVLDVRADAWKEDLTLNNGKWMLPYSDGTLKLGATYEWQRADLETTAENREMLIAKMNMAYPGEIEVIEHKAGLRPTVKDRRPLVGKLPSGLFSFNGLGTRGVLIAPYLANELLSHLLEGKTLDPEIDIQRFLKKL